jgi:hypothetical protein
MDREITVTLTPRLVRWTLYYQFRPLIFIFIFIFLALISNVYIFISRGGLFTWKTCLAYMPAVLIPLFLCTLLYSAYSKSLAQIKKLKSPVMKYRITDDFMQVQSELGSVKNPWSVYKGLRKNEKLWRVISPTGATISLPADILDDKMNALLSTKLSSKAAGAGSRFPLILGVLLLLFIILMYFFKLSPH